DQALYSSGDLQMCPPRRAKVFRKLCGLKYGRPAAAKASLKIARMGPALLQCLRSRPDASKCRLSPTTIFVAGNSGSSSPQSFSLPQVGDPVDHDPADILADRKEPGRERLRELRLHLSRVLVDPPLIDIDVLELEGCDRPVAGAGQDRKGDERARSRRSISVLAGIVRMTCRICSGVGTRWSRWALAILVSLVDRLK